MSYAADLQATLSYENLTREQRNRLLRSATAGTRQEAEGFFDLEGRLVAQVFERASTAYAPSGEDMRPGTKYGVRIILHGADALGRKELLAKRLARACERMPPIGEQLRLF